MFFASTVPHNDTVGLCQRSCHNQRPPWSPVVGWGGGRASSHLSKVFFFKSAMFIISCMHEQSCRRGAHAYPRVVSNVFCTGANTRCPCLGPLVCVVYRIVYNPQAADGLTPSLACPVWFGPICVCLCLVRFSPFMSGPVWSDLVRTGPIRSAPLRSTHVCPFHLNFGCRLIV